MSTFDFGAVVLVLAAVVGVVNDRTLRLPRPVALLLASLAISASIIGTAAIFGLTEIREHSRVRIIHAHLPRLLLDGFLALLLFAGSLHVDATRSAPPGLGRVRAGDRRRRAGHRTLRGRHLGGVVAGRRFPIPPGWCLAIGAVLAPTDAVAVEGLLSRVRLPPALRAIIAGESLFNDGAAVVLFGTAPLAAGQRGHGRLAAIPGRGRRRRGARRSGGLSRPSSSG